VPEIVAQMRAEGARRRIVVVTDEPSDKSAGSPNFPEWRRRVIHRDHLDGVQRELRETSRLHRILIYDQTCATEKRRRRKRGKMVPIRQQRTVINEPGLRRLRRLRQKSFCVSVEPKETESAASARSTSRQLQQGLLLREGLLPQLRHRQGRQPAEEQAGQCRSLAGQSA
jgi:indolepyruvate ferredoxin oxidoreductase